MGQSPQGGLPGQAELASLHWKVWVGQAQAAFPLPTPKCKAQGFMEFGLTKPKRGRFEASQTKAWCGTARRASALGAYKRKENGVRTLQFSLKNKPVKQSQPRSFPLPPALTGGAENICSEREGGKKP